MAVYVAILTTVWLQFKATLLVNCLQTEFNSSEWVILPNSTLQIMQMMENRSLSNVKLIDNFLPHLSWSSTIYPQWVLRSPYIGACSTQLQLFETSTLSNSASSSSESSSPFSSSPSPPTSASTNVSSASAAKLYSVNCDCFLRPCSSHPWYRCVPIQQVLTIDKNQNTTAWVTIMCACVSNVIQLVETLPNPRID